MTDAMHDNDDHVREAGRLLDLAAAGDFENLEAAWVEAIESDAFGLDHLVAVLRAAAVHDSRRAARAMESLVWVMASSLNERRGPGEALDAVWRAGDVLPDSDALREEVAGLYRAAHAQTPHIDTLVAMTIERPDIPLRVGLKRLEKLMQMPVGTFVVDSRRKSPGRVTGVDAARKVLSVSFGESDRSYDAATVENLDLGDPEDFVALRQFDLEGLQALADEDPERLARMVLKAFGPRLGFREFKGHLADVVPAKAWTRWWAGARMSVKRSAWIEVGEGPQPSFYLRPQPRAFQDRAREAFDEAGTMHERLAFVMGYLKETGHDPASEAQLLAQFRRALGQAAAAATSAADAACALAVIDAMHAAHPDAVAAPDVDLAARLGADPVTAVAQVGDDAVGLLAIGYLARALPGWEDVFAAALTQAGPEGADAMAAALDAAGRRDLVTQAAGEIMRRPAQCVGAIFWLWKAATAGRYAEALAGVDRVSLTIRFLQAADTLGRAAEDERSLRPLVAQIRTAVGARGEGPMKAVLEGADDPQAKDIRAAVERNAALTDQIRSRVLDLVRRTHPGHFARPAVDPWDDESVIYTSEKALRHQEEIYGDLVTKKMMANSQAIGDAAAHGDISENAEFTAALEEQQRLTERAQRLQADIARAKIVTPGMAAGDTVTIGSRARVRNLETGAEQEMVFLGPWDTDIANHVYYYRAPLAMAFMGRAAGDVVAFQAGREQQNWEVLEVGPGL
jgi:transcription elongation GreA/GreB family factor